MSSSTMLLGIFVFALVIDANSIIDTGRRNDNPYQSVCGQRLTRVIVGICADDHGNACLKR